MYEKLTDQRHVYNIQQTRQVYAFWNAINRHVS